MPAARVSVLLPARDAASTLGRALASLRRQTEPHFECVILTEGPEDETTAIARGVAARDPRFVVVEHPGATLVEKLNLGIDRCRTPIVARMDADDVAHSTRLARQMARLEAEPTLAAVGARVRIFPRAGLTKGRLAYEQWLNSLETSADIRRNAFVECPIAHPTLMIRRAVLADHGYRDRGWPEDYDLVLRLIDHGADLGVVPQVLLHWRDAPTRVSRTCPSCSLSAITACKAAFLAGGPLGASDRYGLWGYGDTGKAIARALAVHGKHPAWIVERHPRRIGQRILGVSVIAPEALPDADHLPLVISVAGAAARAEIRALLPGLGRRETADCWLVA